MLYQSYAGVVIFVLYLIYDFDRLEKANANGDASWDTVVKSFDLENFLTSQRC